jgi:hypothetical protein
MAARSSLSRWPAPDLPEHGTEARRTRQTVRRILHANADSPLALRSEREKLSELATKERLAVFYTPALLLGQDRLLVQVVRNRVGQIFSMNLDGTDAREFTRAGEGLPYGLSLSPDGT